MRGILEAAHKTQMTKPVRRNSNKVLSATFPRADPPGGFADEYGPFQHAQSRRTQSWIKRLGIRGRRHARGMPTLTGYVDLLLDCLIDGGTCRTSAGSGISFGQRSCRAEFGLETHRLSHYYEGAHA